MSGTIQTFAILEVRVADKRTDGNWTEQTVQIVPAPFWATMYVNDDRYHVEDRTPVGIDNYDTIKTNLIPVKCSAGIGH